jgi:hypothetical protein
VDTRAVIMAVGINGAKEPYYGRPTTLIDGSQIGQDIQTNISKLKYGFEGEPGVSPSY